MFNHSVKVPRNYKIAANIVQKVSEEGASVKTLLYDDKLKHFRVDVLYALVNETIKHADDIEKMFESTGILVDQPRLQPWLAKVLAAELLYGKKSLPGKSKPEQTILEYKERFMKCIPEVQDDHKSKVHRPRYVRINTNLLTTSDAIRAFQDEGYKFIRCTSGSYNDYLEQIQNLAEYDFTQDYHVKTIFVFSPRTKWQNHDFYLENKIVLQDKATSLAVHLLAPPSGSVVLDMCAAPGMKTTQLAAYMRNEGKIYAVERDEKRYRTLCEFVDATGSKCVQTLHKDSLEIRRGDLDDVEYILLDPSCSGSGMELSVHKYVEDTRMAKLTSLQEKFLKHAMNSFPNAKRIVYSTCSIFPEENERVVTNIVKASRAKWRVRDVKELLKDQWNNFGSGMYGSMGTRCLYARPDSDFTTGFFLAVLDRDLRDRDRQTKQQDENEVDYYDKTDNKFKNNKNKNRHGDKNDEKLNANDDVQFDEKQKNKKRHRSSESYNIESMPNPDGFFEGNNGEFVAVNHKNKKRNKNNDIGIQKDSNNLTNISDDIIENGDVNNLTKKKRKSSVKDTDNETVIEIHTELKTKVTDENDELKRPKKKKKKCKELEDELKEGVLETEITTYMYEDIRNIPEALDHNDDIEVPKKKKKKRKDFQNEHNKSISETAMDISAEFRYLPEKRNESNEETEIPKKKKKRKVLENELNEAVSEATSKNSIQIKINDDSEPENIDGTEKRKKKKKKSKECENDDSAGIFLHEEEGKNSKKAKKMKNTT